MTACTPQSNIMIGISFTKKKGDWYLQATVAIDVQAGEQDRVDKWQVCYKSCREQNV